MNAPVNVQDALEASVASTFDVVAWEIELAGARCIQLDSIVGELMRTIPPENRARVAEGLHTVDLLSQHLTGLSAFVRKLSGSAGPDLTVPVEEALREITLGALADRMTGALGGPERGINDREDAGEIDLF